MRNSISHFRFWYCSLGLMALAFSLNSNAQGQDSRPVEPEPQLALEPVLAEDTAIGPATSPAGVANFQVRTDSWPKDVNEISVDIRQTEIEVPDHWEGFFERFARQPLRVPQWRPLQVSWQATEFWHRPLYFDDVPLERYGQMRHPLVQPVFSGVHFFGTVPLLPYKMGLDHPWDKISTLGYYRPGSEAPPVGRRLPLEADAATIEAATWVGLILLLP